MFTFKDQVLGLISILSKIRLKKNEEILRQHLVAFIHLNPKAMQKMRTLMLSPQKEQEVIGTLTYKGKLAAIKLYLAYTGCRLTEAKVAVEKLGTDIEPGQAS